MYRSRETAFTSDAVGRPIAGPLPRLADLHLSLDLKMWLYVLLALGMVSVLAFAHLGQTSYVAKQIDQMETLEYRLLALKQDNNAIRFQIAQFEQTSRLRQQAQAMGLGKPEHIEYVEVPVPEPVPATGGGLMGAVSRARTAVAAPSPTWWIRAAQQFGGWVRVAQVSVARGDSQTSK